MLHIHRSHRLESLAGALAAVTRTPLRSPLAAEIVVVQSLGMRRWLSLELAQQLGVTMNVRFPFPAAFAQEVFRAALGEGDDTGFGRELLPWRVLAAFPRLLGNPGWEELRGYVEGDAGALKAYQLAQRIAAIFDRYLAYRPEMLLKWQSARTGGDWQAQLWRELVKDRKHSHPPAQLQRLVAFEAEVCERRTSAIGGDATGGHRPSLQALPERISVFGLSSLPPLYLHLFDTVSRLLDVHLFLLEPTNRYWGDVVSPREQDRRLRDRDSTPEDEHFETGNSLLSSLGKVGREFTRLVQDIEPHSDWESFDRAEPVSLLHRVQRDIFELNEDTSSERERIGEKDHSIQIHCCHGPMREVEVLYDQLLALFEADPTLTPRDILVAMPDIETYAPFIEAVFGSPEAPSLAIPFTVADRSARAESSVAEAFLRLLDLHGSRFTAPGVLALLDCPAIRARFELSESDLDTIRAWVVEAGIRWGIDEEHRAGLGLPRFRDNTWRAGLDRLLLGYALAGDERTLFGDLLPWRGIEGALAITLGRLVEFAEALFGRVPALGAPRPLREWEHACRDLLHTFFDDSDDFTDEIRRLRDTFAQLSRIAEATAFSDPVAFEVLRAHLASALADTESGPGFLAGAVTFCALKPMRAIPFKVICLLGMDGDAFPRRDPGLAFDRISSEPQRGDRTQRDDDRQLFLEAILSARAVLYLSYSGLSPRDNTKRPPSVVVSELLDYLDTHYAGATGALRKSLLTTHRLQAFSPAYFTGDSGLFSYSEENASTSQSSDGQRVARARLAADPLPDPGPEWRDLEIDQLADFLAHPAKYFARRRLRFALPDEFPPLDESEPLELPGLTRYQLGERLTDLALAGPAHPAQLPVVRASGVLPPGYAGDSAFGGVSRESAALAAKIRARVSGAPLPPLSLDVALGECRLTGTLHGLYPSALLRHRPATLKGKDVLRAWVHHLALQLGENAPRKTWLIASDSEWRFGAVTNASEILSDLAALYLEGLRTPLPFFPAASFEFARRTLAPGPKESTDPLAAARKKWDPDEFRPGLSESEDLWFRLCFPPDPDPLDARWQQITLRIFTPIFAAKEGAE